MKKNFDVELLEEARVFLESLGNKERNKILYNIRKAQYINDNELFKKLNDHIWTYISSFRMYQLNFNTLFF